MLGVGVLGLAVGEHLHLVELVHPDDAAGVLAVAACLAAEARRPAGVPLGAVGEVEDLPEWYPASGTSDVPTR